MQFPVINIGHFAADLLLQDSEGNVMAAFSKVAYLRHAMHELIWIVGPDAPMHRRAIQIAGLLPDFSVNSAYEMHDGTLVFESGLLLDFHQAQHWNMHPFLSSDALPIEILKENIFSFSSFRDFLPPPSGFGIFIPTLMHLLQNQSSIHAAQRLEWKASQKFVWSKIHAIANACLAHDLDGILAHAEELIGLGEGLTPSGDDFMGGLLFCLRNLQDFYNIFHPSFFDKLDVLLPKWKRRTNLISYTLLKDHAHGHTFETLHTFTHALLTREEVDVINRGASALIHIGHSTGWDLLAGTLAGTLLIV